MHIIRRNLYLREILLQTAVRGYKDAKTFAGIVYTTFQESAIARGLIPDRGEAVHAFQEAVQFFTPPELHGYFIMLTVNGYATMDIFRNEHYYKLLQDDFLHDLNTTQAIADQKLIKDLSFRFEMEGQTCSKYGFPEPTEHLSELDMRNLDTVQQSSYCYSIICLPLIRIHPNNKPYSVKLLMISNIIEQIYTSYKEWEAPENLPYARNC